MRVVTKLKCQVCTKYKHKIIGRKNFSEKESVHTTNVTDHAESDRYQPTPEGTSSGTIMCELAIFCNT